MTVVNPLGSSTAVAVTQAQQYRTLADGTNQLTQRQPTPFTAGQLGASPVIVQPSEQFQEVLGLGAAITDASAYALRNYLSASARAALLLEAFGPAQNNFSTIRVPMGWQTFAAATPYTYDDNGGVVDSSLTNFSVARDAAYIIPTVQEILAINPRTRVIASLWWPPAWMLTDPTKWGIAPSGTSFNTAYYSSLAQYFVKFIQAYLTYGIPIFAVTLNEPFGASFSQAFSSAEQIAFFGTHLGPALVTAGLGDVKIWGMDDSWGGGASFANALMADTTAGPYFEGVAWHAYGGSPTTQSSNRRVYPTKSQHFTEMRNLAAETYAQSVAIMAGDVVIGSLRNWGKSVTLWNFALDQNGAPNNGTGTGRLGVVTIHNTTGVITRNVSYYALAHVAKFLQPGARRCQSSSYGIGNAGGGVQTVAFVNPDESVVLVAWNATGAPATFQVAEGRTGKSFPVTMAADEMSTFVWGTTAQATPAGVAATINPPAQPVVTATGGTGQVSLSWPAPSSPAAPISGYALYRSTSSGAETLLTVLPASATSYVDLTPSSGTYYYTLIARNAGGDSTASTEKSAASSGNVAVLDAQSGTSTAGVSATLTWNHTTSSGPNRLLVVTVHLADPAAETTTGITHDGVALTKLGAVASPAGGFSKRVELWYLINPTAGTKQIVVTNSAAQNCNAQALTYTGVHQTTPLGTAGTNNSASTNNISATTTGGATTDLVLAALIARTTVAPTPGVGQTSRWSTLVSTNQYGVGSSQTGGTATITSAFTWTTVDNAALIAVAIKAA